LLSTRQIGLNSRLTVVRLALTFESNAGSTVPRATSSSIVLVPEVAMSSQVRSRWVSLPLLIAVLLVTSAGLFAVGVAVEHRADRDVDSVVEPAGPDEHGESGEEPGAESAEDGGEGGRQAERRGGTGRAGKRRGSPPAGGRRVRAAAGRPGGLAGHGSDRGGGLGVAGRRGSPLSTADGGGDRCCARRRCDGLRCRGGGASGGRRSAQGGD